MLKSIFDSFIMHASGDYNNLIECPRETLLLPTSENGLIKTLLSFLGRM